MWARANPQGRIVVNGYVCGYDSHLIEQSLEQLTHQFVIKWIRIESTLEDAFISLVQQTPEPLVD